MVLKNNIEDILDFLVDSPAVFGPDFTKKLHAVEFKNSSAQALRLTALRPSDSEVKESPWIPYGSLFDLFWGHSCF